MPYYITTPIYYVNDRPHIGHCYTTLLADVLARFHRLVGGQEVFFLTGTDEHADKVVTSAAKNGYGPQEWADLNAEEFKKAFALFNISNDDFIRTTQPRHKDRVVQYITRLMKSDDIYKGDYTGWYDEGQEEYVTDNAAREADFKSTISGKPLVKRTEPCYFFRLGKYQQKLFNLISTDESFVRPDSRRQEILGRLRPPAVLNDVPVSRPVTDDPATQWGIRIPGDDAHRIYVWIDALFNYLSVVDNAQQRHLWPAAVHLIGKDILWFHTVIWPALLMALGEPLPKTVFGHGWWIANGQKMSKTLGNFIDIENLQAYAAKYSLDAVRWYLATQGPLSGADADFSEAKFIEVYNAELANSFGNSTSRVGNMVEKYFGGEVPAATGDGRFAPGEGTPLALALAARANAKNPAAPGTESRSFDFPAKCRECVDAAVAAASRQEIDTALRAGLTLVRSVDDFISHTAPFTLAKQFPDGAGKTALAQILYACAESLRIASILLSPAMPQKCAALWTLWNCHPAQGATLQELCTFGGPHAIKAGQKVAKGEALFMRA
ncbi:MAG: methionine--tRNA ligase [Phycisphaerales bacterium]